MTFEQLIQELLVNHWIFSTICLPWLTFVYAWITDQTLWWIVSAMIGIFYLMIRERK